ERLTRSRFGPGTPPWLASKRRRERKPRGRLRDFRPESLPPLCRDSLFPSRLGSRGSSRGSGAPPPWPTVSPLHFLPELIGPFGPPPGSAGSLDRLRETRLPRASNVLGVDQSAGKLLVGLCFVKHKTIK